MGNAVVLIIKKPFLPAANISGFYLENGVGKNGGRLLQQGILPGGPFLELVQKMKEFVSGRRRAGGRFSQGEILLKSKL